MEKIKQLVISEEGQSLVEYGLIIGLVSVALVAALGTMQTELSKIFDQVSKALGGAAKKIKVK